jgi:hypothetical protein
LKRCHFDVVERERSGADQTLEPKTKGWALVIASRSMMRPARIALAVGWN